MSVILPLFAALSGEKLLNALIELAIGGGVLFVLWWGLKKINPPEPLFKVATVILVLITVVFLVNLLLGLNDQRFIKW